MFELARQARRVILFVLSLDWVLTRHKCCPLLKSKLASAKRVLSKDPSSQAALHSITKDGIEPDDGGWQLLSTKLFFL